MVLLVMSMVFVSSRQQKALKFCQKLVAKIIIVGQILLEVMVVDLTYFFMNRKTLKTSQPALRYIIVSTSHPLSSMTLVTSSGKFRAQNSI